MTDPDPIEELARGRRLRLVNRNTWEYVERIGSTGIVAITALTEANELLLVEQFRVPLQQRVIELPAGLVGDVGDSEEHSEIAARRELEEETGFTADRFTLLTVGPPSAGLSTEVIDFYGAVDCRQIGPGGGDDSENITVHRVPMSEVASWLHSRTDVIIDPKVWTGLYFAEHQDDWA